MASVSWLRRAGQRRILRPTSQRNHRSKNEAIDRLQPRVHLLRANCSRDLWSRLRSTMAAAGDRGYRRQGSSTRKALGVGRESILAIVAPKITPRQGSSVVEQGTHKPLVGSSTLPPGTPNFDCDIGL